MGLPSLNHVMLVFRFFALNRHLNMTGFFSNIVMSSKKTLNLGLDPENERIELSQLVNLVPKQIKDPGNEVANQ